MSNGIDKQVHLDATAPYIDIVNGDKKILLNIDENASYEDDYPPIRMYLNSDGFESVITPYGFCNKTDDGYKLNASGYEIGINRGDDDASYLSESKLSFHTTNGTELQMNLGLDFESGAYGMTIGSDEKFKISRSTDNTEGATITGVKSITAFANPSATEVWATDGSTADLSTKANVSDLSNYANLKGTNVFSGNNTFTAGGNVQISFLKCDNIRKTNKGYLFDLDDTSRNNHTTYTNDGGKADIGTEESFVFTLEDGSTVTKSIRVVSTTTTPAT